MAFVSFLDFIFFLMLCKVIAHRLVVQWVNIKISYLLLFCWLSIFEAVESVQSSGVEVNLAASYLSSTFFGRRYSASVLKPLKSRNRSLILRENFFHKTKQKPSQPCEKYYRKTLGCAYRIVSYHISRKSINGSTHVSTSQQVICTHCCAPAPLPRVHQKTDGS